MLYWLAVVDSLLGAVYPSEAQSHLHCIHIADNTRELFPRPVDTKPEVRYLVMILKIPGIEFFAGVDIKEISDFH